MPLSVSARFPNICIPERFLGRMLKIPPWSYSVLSQYLASLPASTLIVEAHSLASYTCNCANRDDCLDIGSVIGFDYSSNSIQLVNLYMDHADCWAEHGDAYEDSVSEDSVIKKVLLTKSGKLARRFL
jgi:hypothetical protein